MRNCQEKQANLYQKNCKNTHKRKTAKKRHISCKIVIDRRGNKCYNHIEKLNRESDDMTKGDIAKNNFQNGCNCAQAVLLAFCEDYGMDRETAMMISASFGAGMGGLRVRGKQRFQAVRRGVQKQKRLAYLPRAARDQDKNKAHLRRPLQGRGRYP